MGRIKQLIIKKAYKIPEQKLNLLTRKNYYCIIGKKKIKKDSRIF